MIVIIGVLLLLCLLGLWAALNLDEPRPHAPAPDNDEIGERPWVHVEAGPDSFHPVGARTSSVDDEADGES
jgi:hypothetical protein